MLLLSFLTLADLSPQCFLCSVCKSSLAGVAFAEHPSSGAPVCETCIKKVVSGGTQHAIVAQQHDGFTINPITGKKEMRQQGGAKFPGSEPPTKLGGVNSCAGCAQAVYMSDQVSGPKFTQWHRSCLSCVRCKKGLDSMATVDDRAGEGHWKAYCKNCSINA
jgi:hypothetical protein